MARLRVVRTGEMSQSWEGSWGCLLRIFYEGFLNYKGMFCKLILCSQVGNSTEI